MMDLQVLKRRREEMMHEAQHAEAQIDRLLNA